MVGWRAEGQPARITTIMEDARRYIAEAGVQDIISSLTTKMLSQRPTRVTDFFILYLLDEYPNETSRADCFAEATEIPRPQKGSRETDGREYIDSSGAQEVISNLITAICLERPPASKDHVIPWMVDCLIKQRFVDDLDLEAAEVDDLASLGIGTHRKMHQEEEVKLAKEKLKSAEETATREKAIAEKAAAEKKAMAEKAAAEKAPAEKMRQRAAALGLLSALQIAEVDSDVTIAASVKFCTEQGARSANDIVHFGFLDMFVKALVGPGAPALP